MIKYPRTSHLPNSLGKTDDDKTLQSLDCFNGKRLLATLKMDGENTTMYRDNIHARSLAKMNHLSQDWVKKFWSNISYEIPEGWRICGENMFAKHSIAYENLESYFYGFSIWNDENICLPWIETKEWFKLLKIEAVNDFAIDFTIDQLDDVHEKFVKEYAGCHEGYVIRNMDSFHYDDFKDNVGKFVRKDHVENNTKHWTRRELIANKLNTKVDEK